MNNDNHNHEASYKFELINHINRNNKHLDIKVTYIDRLEELVKKFDFTTLREKGADVEIDTLFAKENTTKKLLLLFDIDSYNSMSLLEAFRNILQENKLTDKEKNLLSHTEIVYCDNYNVYLSTIMNSNAFKTLISTTYGTYMRFLSTYGKNVVPTILYVINNEIYYAIESGIFLLNEHSLLDFFSEIATDTLN